MVTGRRVSLRRLAFVVLAAGTPVFVASSPLLAQPARSALQRAAASVVTVTTRDHAGRTIATGIGFFTDIGRLIAHRHLLRGASEMTVRYAGSEYKVSAVLAEDRRAETVLLAVDLPEGAPPAIHAPAGQGAVSPTANLLALDPTAPPLPVHVQPVVELPGLGAVQLVSDASSCVSGMPVVDEGGELVGALSVHELGEAKLVLMVPATRLSQMEPVGPIPLADWSARAGDTRPAESDAAFLRGAREALNGRREQALQDFSGVTRHHPEDAEAWAAMADCQRALGRRDQAIAAWRQALAAQPANPRFHHELALEFTDAGRWEDAAREFGEVTRLRPNDPEAAFNLGNAYGHLGRYADEYAAYQKTLAVDPAHVGALKNLGIACIALKRYNEAVTAFTRAGRLAPSDPDVHTSLGVSYYDLKDYPAAIAALQEAVRLTPSSAKAHFGLGVVYAASGHRAEAQQECAALKPLDRDKAAQLCGMVR